MKYIKLLLQRSFFFLYLKTYDGKALRSFEEVLWDVDVDLHGEDISIPTDEVKEDIKEDDKED